MPMIPLSLDMVEDCIKYVRENDFVTMQFYQENIFLSLVFVLQFAFFVFLFTQQKLKFTS